MAIQGIIRPPPDIRVVADRTAMFVAKNGRAFESRILGSAKGKTPKFAFLQPTSPFHAYYEDRIKHFESGEGDEKKTAEEEAKKKSDGSNDSQKETTEEKWDSNSVKKPAKENVTKQKASIMDPVAKAILGQRSVIANHLKKEKEKRRMAAEAAASTKATPDDENGQGENGVEQAPESDSGEKMLPLPAPPMPLDTVHVVAPYYLTPTQIETIQLVAQFVAMDGKGGPFLPALINREWSNPDFGFCQPRNINFSYFSALVDAYRKILSDFVEAADSSTTTTTIEGATSLDSNKPTVAIKIEEGADTQAQPETPKPVYDVQAALNDAAYRTEYERELERRRQKHQENSNVALEDGEIANVIDWHDFIVVETIDFPIEEQVDVGLSMLPTKTANTTATTPNTVASANISGTAGGAAATTGSADMDMEESSDEEDDDADNIRVVPSYTPKVVGTYDPSTARVVDPITGKSVSVADMPEHMRIQLLDPKWAEERKKFQDKQKDSNLVGGDAVVANIARMSQKAAAAPSSALGASTTNTSGSVGHSRPASYAVGAPAVTTAPVVGPAEGRGDPRRVGQQQQQQQYGGFRGPPSSGGGGTETEQPPSKRQRTAPVLPPSLLQQQQKHKVTIAPPLVVNQQAINNNDGLMLDDPPKPAINDPMQSTTDDPPAAEKKELLSAEEFIASLGENPVVELQVRLPNDATSHNWNFFGQTLTLGGIDPKSSVRDIKVVLSEQHLNNMPVNKIQLKISTSSTDVKGKFLNNNATLAALNIGPTAELELKTKLRGGRK